MALSLANRKKIILEYYDRFHDPKFLEWDPLLVIRPFLQHPHVEWVAMMAAVFAFGGVKQVIASTEKSLKILELDPASSAGLFAEFMNGDLAAAQVLNTRFQVFRHRIYIGQDVVALLSLYRRSVREHGSLKNHFLKHHRLGARETIEESLSSFIDEYSAWSKELEAGPHFKHMLNSPADGSACKRWLMFLKWMIREDDGIDLGVWSGEVDLKASQLVIPLDTHLWNVSKKLGLTQRNTANFTTALEITQKLRQIDELDPIKFDFALCRWGMLDYRKMIEPSVLTKPQKKKTRRKP